MKKSCIPPRKCDTIIPGATVSAPDHVKEIRMNTQPRILAQEVSYTYEEAETPALQKVSAAIAPGEFVAVLGHNGSGKSTFAKLLNALYIPTEGRLLVCGLDTREEDKVWDVRQHAGMIFQNQDNQLVATVVREDVAFGLENLGVPTDEMVRRIDAALEAVHMTEFAASAPHLLSGGQKQRVAIAGVLAMEPECIVLDESTAMLDPVGRREVLSTVKQLNREKGITVVLITHHMDEAAQADRLVVMHDGRVVRDGPPAQVFQDVDGLRALGLEVPESVALMYELRKSGVDAPLDALDVESCAAALQKLLSEGT